ncbi:MAG TPA: dihydrolipoyl dehydrogenase [Tepidisphaeraceae bacterium]|jgi:dihydrolipoamide dehydrogenase|nr:dihydrolipoyl dehydrogenase [Tepidisphaeraceae bacterium]
MPAEFTMPQMSDTMTEGAVVKWRKKEGEKIKAGEVFAEIETDKAVMESEAFDSGTVAAILVPEGQKAKVGTLLAVIATGSEKPDEVKKQYSSRAAGAKTAAAAPATAPKPSAPAPAAPKPAPAAKPSAPAKATGSYNYDIIVIGGGPAGYAAAIRAGQLKKRVLCIERENLGGTCLNWGCIPTKALLEDGAFIRRLRTEADKHGLSFQNLQVDFGKLVGRSRAIADKLAKGVAHLFQKYGVQSEKGTGQLLAPHRVRLTIDKGSREITAEHVILASGAKATPLPFAPFDGKTIISSREAMILPQQPKRMAIIGAGAIGCEFADFYNAVGTEVTLIEMLPQILPNEEEDVARVLKQSFAKRGITVFTGTKTDKIEKKNGALRLSLSGENSKPVDVDVVLVAIGVTGYLDGLAAPDSKLELFKNRVKVDPEYRTNLENVWAIGDCISLHWPEQSALAGYRHPDLAHVAHHEAVNVVEHICGVSDHTIDYRQIPACTYTHPQVASMGQNEKKLREEGRQLKIGKFPFTASGRALAAGETEGFVKLIFDAKYGELLGVHMIGENVTELLAELVMARKLEATEAEIIEAMHPHPTMSEAVMEAAGIADGRSIHL